MSRIGSSRLPTQAVYRPIDQLQQTEELFILFYIDAKLLFLG
jgi:hypothetical protein